MSAPDWTLPKVEPLGWEPTAWVPEPEESNAEPDGALRDAGAHYAQIERAGQAGGRFLSNWANTTGIGDYKELAEVFADRDLITGEDKDWWEHVLAVGGLVLEKVDKVVDTIQAGKAGLDFAIEFGRAARDAPNAPIPPAAGVPEE